MHGRDRGKYGVVVTRAPIIHARYRSDDCRFLAHNLLTDVRCVCRPIPTQDPILPTQPPATPKPGTGGGGTDQLNGDGDGKHIPPREDEKGAGVVVNGEGPGAPPVAAAQISAGAGADAVSTRSAAVAGTMLGILAAASGLAWALYKFKPGLIPGMGRAAAPSAAAPLLGANSTGPASGANAAGAAATAPPADAGGQSVATMPAAGYSSMSRGAAAGGAYSRGFGVLDTSQTTTTVIETAGGAGAGGAAGAAAGSTSTMNRGIQTEVANGPMADGAAAGTAAGAASSSTFVQSSRVVKNVYESQQTGADTSLVDG